MKRITNKELHRMVDYLNRVVGAPLEPWSKGRAGKYRANIGNYHLSFAYGGVCVHRMHSSGGGVTTPIIGYHTTKRELWAALNAYIAGIMEGQP